MKARQTLLAIVAGLLGVVMFLALFWLPFVLGSLMVAASALPLLLAGLAYGPRAAFAATAAGMAVLAAYGFLYGSSLYGIDLGSPSSWAYALALAYGLQDGLPAIAVGWLARPSGASGTDGRLPRRPPLSLIVNSLCAAALLLVVALLLMLPGGDGVAPNIEAGLNAWQDALGPEAPALEAPSLGLWIKSTFGILGALWVLQSLLLAVLAYKILAASGKPPCPPPLYSAFEAPKGMCAAALLTFLTAFVTDGRLQAVAVSATLILALPLFLQGMAAAHVVARSLPHPEIWLTVFYCLLVLLMLRSGWVFPAVTALGLVDQAARLRSRRSDASRQEEV